MRSHYSFSKSVFFFVVASVVVLSFMQSLARERSTPLSTDGARDLLGILVLDGSGVHDVGELLIHTGNWGIFGSYPGSTLPISEFPSAEWPAGSGVEHLNIAGLWIGAVKGCLLSDQVLGVSTAAYEMEFRPTDDSVDRIYETHEGALGGNRLSSPNADDDGDGLIDEDPLDGRDNDEDGLVDEDFAAISQQMFSSWFTDDQPAATEQYPEHEPLHVTVCQESYQWTDPRFDDFVGISFTITNTGTGPNCLNHLYLGFFVDGDIGMRDVPEYWNDDAAGSWQGIRCTELGPANISIGYMYDEDGDEGQATSYIGAMILGHPVSADGIAAPTRVGMTSFRIFSGDQPYENGGDPTNDFERYEALSEERIDGNQSGGDKRILISAGPFGLNMGSSMTFHVGLVAGGSLDELIDNAAICQKLYDGLWFDVDGDPATGTDRRETMVSGPATGIVIDPCRSELSDPVAIARGEMLYINADCEWEEELKAACNYAEADSMLFRTGVTGRETHVNWIYERPQILHADLDIKPGSCPNPFNVKVFEFLSSGNHKKGGVLPVAVVGSEGMDVRDIDIETVRLEQVGPLPRGCGYEDVSSPVYGGAQCECMETGPDGYEDLVLKFSKQQIASALMDYGLPEAGQEALLVLRGNLVDGTPFEAADCILFVGLPPEIDHGDRRLLGVQKTRLFDATPNPFNPTTMIRFDLPRAVHVKLDIYNVKGELISTIVDQHMTEGRKEVSWTAKDNRGRAVSSGIYFYRLVAGDFVQTKKMVLLR